MNLPLVSLCKDLFLLLLFLHLKASSHWVTGPTPGPFPGKEGLPCLPKGSLADKEIHGLEMLVLPVWLCFSGPGTLPYKQYEVKFSVRKGGGWQC